MRTRPRSTTLLLTAIGILATASYGGASTFASFLVDVNGASSARSPSTGQGFQGSATTVKAY